MNTNREEMQKMKAWLKVTAKQIREMKKQFKDAQRGAGESWKIGMALRPLQWNYRHNHIAYSLARGKTLEQIESKHKKDENGREMNLPNMSEANKILLTLLVKEEVMAVQT